MGRSPPTKVVVSAQTVVELAKGAVVPIRCAEYLQVSGKTGAAAAAAATTCGQEFGSWKLFLQHLLKKHSGKRKGTNIFKCGLNKCSAQNHHSQADLKTHIEASHMKNIPFPCPFARCKPRIPDFGRATPYNMFARKSDLVAHLEGYHSSLIGRELDVRSHHLLPNSDPRPPIRPLPAPPDLPSGPIPTAQFRVEALPERRIYSSNWMARLDGQGSSSSSGLLAPSSTPVPPTPTPSSSRFPLTPKTPMGRRPLLRTSSLLPSSPGGSEAEPQYEFEFADLPVVYWNDQTRCMFPANVVGPPRFVVQRVGEGFADRADLVRPLPMPRVPIPDAPPPPTSIFHEALRQQVFAQYALGEDAATDLGSAVLPND
ncbi:hypothetical protein DFH06DRAFT_1161504 [Mycena polygramma]|nr:hypothetical protein DFH06DRAFT_1161504 [Mycena polygramma]